MLKTELSITEDLFEKLQERYLAQSLQVPQKAKLYRRNAPVYGYGEVPKGIFFLKSGSLKVIRIGANGREVIIRVAAAHDFVGYLSLLKSSFYLTSAIALEDAEVYFFPKKVFLEAIDADSDFAYDVIDLVCNNSLNSTAVLVDMASKSVKQRLCAALLTLSKIEGTSDQVNNKVSFRKKDISAMIGAAPETVSRYLAELENEALISVYQAGIEIVNKQGLIAVSNLGD